MAVNALNLIMNQAKNFQIYGDNFNGLVPLEHI